MSELSYKELQEQGVFDVPYRAFKYMQSQQAKIDELQARVPEGYVVVPVKCTNNMAHAAKEVDGRLSAFKYGDVWNAMLEAVEK